ncbi:hypothetical protein VP01_431g10 [Puccinia sorghi]|uniref:Uncharacterized protein n=1 Tax=Puccinia sorghi TaxID=27349 RepID=A0A0L6UQ25_9BASI|nr:hypothetical protein VP01_431g10 [Puccinia sorghi]
MLPQMDLPSSSLKFYLAYGQIVRLLHILFCEQAKATLIFMAALRKDNTNIHWGLSNMTKSTII